MYKKVKRPGDWFKCPICYKIVKLSTYNNHRKKCKSILEKYLEELNKNAEKEIE